MNEGDWLTGLTTLSVRLRLDAGVDPTGKIADLSVNSLQKG